MLHIYTKNDSALIVFLPNLSTLLEFESLAIKGKLLHLFPLAVDAIRSMIIGQCFLSSKFWDFGCRNLCKEVLSYNTSLNFPSGSFRKGVGDENPFWNLERCKIFLAKYWYLSLIDVRSFSRDNSAVYLKFLMAKISKNEGGQEKLVTQADFNDNCMQFFVKNVQIPSVI